MTAWFKNNNIENNISNTKAIATYTSGKGNLKKDAKTVYKSAKLMEKQTQDTPLNKEKESSGEKRKKSNVMQYEIKFLSDRVIQRERNPATFLQRNYKRNKERILFSYLVETKQFKRNQTKYYDTKK